MNKHRKNILIYISIISILITSLIFMFNYVFNTITYIAEYFAVGICATFIIFCIFLLIFKCIEEIILDNK